MVLPPPLEQKIVGSNPRQYIKSWGIKNCDVVMYFMT
jgi:hypothetical protein